MIDRLASVVALALVTACTRSPQPVARVHSFSNNWGAGAGDDDSLARLIGCTPTGPELSLRGTIVVSPFGKGTNGAQLKTDTEQWVVSYRATGALLELEGKQVVARGRASDKGGESIGGRHFDLSTLEELPP